MNILFLIPVFALSANAALAEERATVVADCVRAFAAGDAAELKATSTIVRSWGEITDTNLKLAAESCLSFAPNDIEQNQAAGLDAPVSGSSLQASVPKPEDQSKSPEEIARLSRLVAASIQNKTFDFAHALIKKFGERSTWTDEFVIALEDSVLAAVRPLPASDAISNAEGYEILAMIQPDNLTYKEKAASYRKAETDRPEKILLSLVEKRDKVAGTTFLSHKNEPRFANTRSTIWLYIVKSSSGGKPMLRVRGNYTSDSWLFAKKMTVYIDGSTTTFFAGAFERDNNSGIWEWFDIVPSELQIDLLSKMAKGKEVILRFDGRQYHDDATVSKSDKTAISDILDVYAYLKAKN